MFDLFTDVVTYFGCLSVIFLIVLAIKARICTDQDDPGEKYWQWYYDEYLVNLKDESLNWNEDYKEGL